MKIKSQTPLKEYLGKSSIYLHKLCIIIFIMKHAEFKKFDQKLNVIEVELAYEFIEFFILNFKKLIAQKSICQISKYDIVKFAKSNNIPQKLVVAFTGYSKGQVSKLWNKL